MKKKIAIFLLAILAFSIFIYGEGFCQEKKDEKPGKKTPGEHSKSLVEKAHKLLEEGDLNKAAVLVNKAIKIYPGNEDAWVAKGFIYLSKEKYNFAMGTYKKALARLPKSAKIWFHYGVASGKSGQFGYAIKCFEKAIKYKSDYADAWKYKGYALTKLYRFPQAIPCFKKALEINPQDLRAKLFLGISYYQTGEEDKGKGLIWECLKTQPNIKQEMPKSLQKAMGI